MPAGGSGMVWPSSAKALNIKPIKVIRTRIHKSVAYVFAFGNAPYLLIKSVRDFSYSYLQIYPPDHGTQLPTLHYLRQNTAHYRQDLAALE